MLISVVFKDNEWRVEGPNGPYLFGDDHAAAMKAAQEMQHEYTEFAREDE